MNRLLIHAMVIFIGENTFGYNVGVGLSAKNQFAGYTGYKYYYLPKWRNCI